MQSVNDDMDELFRQAAEGYPLATSGAAWEKVASALKGEHAQNATVAKERSYRKLLWLLCLLPLGLVCNRWSSLHSGAGATAKTSASLNKEVISTRQNTPAENTALSPQSPSGSAFVKGSGSEEKPNPPSLNYPASSSALSTNSNKKDHSGYHFLSSGRSGVQKRPATAEIPYSNDAALFDNDLLPRATAFTRSLPANAGMKRTRTAGKASREDLVRQPLPENTAPSIRQKKFYAVLTGGLDATTVHFQKTEHLGHHYGGMIGYQLGRKWSVEAGLLLDRKYYYTEGRYFNTSKVYMPPNSKVTEVYGNCRMFEIPLAVHYQLSSQAHSSWFAGAGLSSYIMKREYYNYLYYYGNSATQAYHDKIYQNSSRNFFSVLQLSAGYSHSIGRTTSLRIEPYAKLPIASIGFGKLPLLSTGLNIGIKKTLF